MIKQKSPTASGYCKRGGAKGARKVVIDFSFLKHKTPRIAGVCTNTAALDCQNLGFCINALYCLGSRIG